MKRWIIGLSLLVILGLTGWLASAYLRPHIFHGMVLQASEPAVDFTLTGPGERAVSLTDFQGKLVVLVFGYTFCPDVCPTTLAKVAQALDQLGPQAKEVQVLMVTVDPERDTADKLAEYLAHFDPTFIGLSGTTAEISAVATAFGVYYQAHPETATSSGYLVDHTATILVIDRQGYLRLIFPFGTSAQEIREDLAYMLR